MAGREDFDARIVRGQLGRQPRGRWRVAARCGHGRPRVIASPPLLDDGTRFPTLFWLTCPWLAERIYAEESTGTAAEMASKLAEDEHLAREMREADAEYRRLREAAGGGEDACSDVGIAGQSDPLGTKCLHAHVAAYLAGVNDPVGRLVLDRLFPDPPGSTSPDCCDDRCARLSEDSEATE